MKQLLTIIFLYALNGSGSNSQQRTVTCRMNRHGPTAQPSNVDILVLRDIQLGFRFPRIITPMDAKTISCKAALKTVKNMVDEKYNSILDRILRYHTKTLLPLSKSQRDEFWRAVTARGYDNAVLFQDGDTERVLVAKSKALLKNKTLIISGRDQKPSFYTTWAKDRKTLLDVGGNNFDLIVMLQKYLGFKFIPVFEGASFSNGTWKGVVGMLVKKEIDVCIQPLALDWGRVQVTDFTSFLAGSPFSLMIPYPQETRSLLASTWPFTPTVWLCIVGTIIILAIVLTMMVRALQNAKTTKDVLADSFLFLYGVICCQGMDCPGGSNFKIRTVAGLWCLAAIIFVYSYNSQLTSYLTVPQLEPLVNSMQDLASTNQLYPLAMVGNSIVTDMLNATSGTYKLLGDRVRQNYNKSIASSFDEAMQRMSTGRYAFAVNQYTGGHYGDLLFRETRKCTVLFTKEPINFVYSQWLLQKNSPYLRAINDKIGRVPDHGLMTYLMRHSNKGLPRFQDFCKVPVKDIPMNAILNLGQLQSAFAVLGIGFTAALITFLFERYLAFRSIKARY